jgi:hypothetical protein
MEACFAQLARNDHSTLTMPLGLAPLTTACPATAAGTGTLPPTGVTWSSEP